MDARKATGPDARPPPTGPSAALQVRLRSGGWCGDMGGLTPVTRPHPDVAVRSITGGSAPQKSILRRVASLSDEVNKRKGVNGKRVKARIY